ncbi:MBL fold metallo-hydrolase [Neobacillus drentensis]|uniref:MBL fold metallo-hydrolase n=1 Tax=Neobacillus drentensis TaxID=220684 RepID=UPI003000F938
MGTFQTKYFQLQQVANGVFAAIINRGSGCIANAAVINLGGKTVVWDTFQNPRAAEELRKFATLEFGDQPILVINSHNHLDHCGGNQVFKDCRILSTSKTREAMESLNPKVIESMKSQPDQSLEYTKLIEEETDINRRNERILQFEDYKEFSDTVKNLQLTLPNMTFDHSMTLHGQNRTAHLFCYGGGHSPSDLILHLEEEGILLIGDLITVGSHPLLRYGNVDEWLTILDKIESLPIKQIMPGHGTVVGKEQIKAIRDYYSGLIEIANQCVASGGTLEEMQNISVPQEYESWRLPHLYSSNLKDIYLSLHNKLQTQK